MADNYDEWEDLDDGTRRRKDRRYRLFENVPSWDGVSEEPWMDEAEKLEARRKRAAMQAAGYRAGPGALAIPLNQRPILGDGPAFAPSSAAGPFVLTPEERRSVQVLGGNPDAPDSYSLDVIQQRRAAAAKDSVIRQRAASDPGAIPEQLFAPAFQGGYTQPGMEYRGPPDPFAGLGVPAQVMPPQQPPMPRTPLGLPDDLQSVADRLASYGGAAAPDYRYRPTPTLPSGGVTPEVRDYVMAAMARRQKAKELADVNDPRGFKNEFSTLFGNRSMGKDPTGAPLTPETNALVEQMMQENLNGRADVYRDVMGAVKSPNAQPAQAGSRTGLPAPTPASVASPSGGEAAYNPAVVDMMRASAADPAMNSNSGLGFPVRPSAWHSRFVAENRAAPSGYSPSSTLLGTAQGVVQRDPQLQAELDSILGQTGESVQRAMPTTDLAASIVAARQPNFIRSAGDPTADLESASPLAATRDLTLNQDARTLDILKSVRGMSSADRIAMLQRVAPQQWNAEPAVGPTPRIPTTAEMIADMRAREGGPTASNAVADARSAMLARNPMLRDRIAAERQLTQRMQPMEVAQANTGDARANALLADARATRASNSARGINPVPIDQELFRAAQAKRAATEDARRQMVSAIARGRQGMYTSQDVMNQMLMRNPQAMAAQLAAQSAGARNATDLQISQNGLEAANTMRMGDREFQAGQDKARWEAEARLRQIVPGTQVAETNLEKSKIIGRISALKDLRNQSPPAKQLEYDAQIKALEGEINGINSFQQQAAPVQGGASPGMISTAPPTRRSAMDVAKMLVAGGRQGEKLSEFLQRARMEKDNLSDSDPTGVAALDLLSNHIRSTFPGEIDAEKANTYPSLWNRGYYREYQPGGTLADNPPLRLAEGVRDASLIAPFITNLVGAAGRGVGAFEGESNDAYNRRLWARGLLNRRPR